MLRLDVRGTAQTVKRVQPVDTSERTGAVGIIQRNDSQARGLEGAQFYKATV